MLWEEALFLWPDLKELQKLKKLEEVRRSYRPPFAGLGVKGQ